MKCPRDAKPLVFVDDGRHLRDRCPTCEGILLDRAEVAAALGKAQGRSVALATERVASLPEGTLKCPRDARTMHRLDHSGIELDLCPACSSLWLDAGELDKIRGGGAKAGAGAKAAAGAKAGGARKAALVGAAAVAGATVATAAASDKSTLASVGEAVADVAVEGGIDLVFEFAVEAISALFS